MEQFEDGVDDHNVLARFADETVKVTNELRAVRTDFVLNLGGRFLSAQDAEAHVVGHMEHA